MLLATPVVPAGAVLAVSSVAMIAAACAAAEAAAVDGREGCELLAFDAPTPPPCSAVAWNRSGCRQSSVPSNDKASCIFNDKRPVDNIAWFQEMGPR